MMSLLPGLASLLGCGARTVPYAPLDSDLAQTIEQAEAWKQEQRAKSAARGTPTTQESGGEAGAGKPSPLKPQAGLEAILRHTARHSPLIQASRYHWQAALQKHPQAVSLPDPMLNWKYFVHNVETRTGPQKWSLGLSQRFPYPGKLIIAGRIADKAARAAYLRYEAVVRDELAKAKERYFELYYIDRAQGVTGEIRKLYERYAALAAGGKRIAGTKLPETFRAESQRAQLGYDLILLKEMRAAEAERLRAVMGLPAGALIGRTKDVAEPAPLALRLEELRAVALKYNQELAAAGVEVERADYQTRLARRAPIPDLTIGADFIKTGRPVRALRKTDDGGKDAIALGVGISIPLWFPKYRAQLKEARQQELAARAQHKAVRLNLRADLARVYFRLSNASRLVRLYRDTLLPQARQALQSAEELYRTGEANLASVLETTATVHNFELARLRAVADFYQNVARMERILGRPLERKPAAAPEKGAKEAAPQAKGAKEAQP